MKKTDIQKQELEADIDSLTDKELYESFGLQIRIINPDEEK